ALMGLEFLQRSLHVEVAPGPGPRIRQDVPGHLAQRGPEPDVLRRHESHLVRTPPHLVRQDPVQRLSEDCLGPAVPDLQLRSQSTLPVMRLRTRRTNGDGRNARARFATTYGGIGPCRRRKAANSRSKASHRPSAARSAKNAPKKP